MMLRRRTSGSQESRQQMQSHIPAGRAEAALNAHADDLHIKHEMQGGFKMKRADWERRRGGGVGRSRGYWAQPTSCKCWQNYVAGKQCLHNSPTSSCACKYGKLPNGKKGHEPNKACGVSRRQPEGCNDSKETNHSAPACATQHPLSIHSPCEGLEKSYGHIVKVGGDRLWGGGGGKGYWLGVCP